MVLNNVLATVLAETRSKMRVVQKPQDRIRNVTRRVGDEQVAPCRRPQASDRWWHRDDRCAQGKRFQHLVLHTDGVWSRADCDRCTADIRAQIRDMARDTHASIAR